jgi:HK97 family phage major capsid protein
VNKEQIRLKEITAKLDSLSSKDILSDNEEREFNDLSNEALKLLRQLEANSIKDALNEPADRPIKPELNSESREDKPIGYEKRSLDKYADYIRSRGNLEVGKRLSFGKAILGMATGNWKGREEERDAMSTSADGMGNLISEELSSEIIPLALNRSQVMTAGARVIPFEEKTLLIPKVSQSVSSEWKAEGEKFSDATMTMTGVELEAKVIGILTKISVELAQDGHGVEQLIENEIAKQIALGIDAAALDGDGSGQSPTGIFYTDNVLEEDVGNVDLTDYSPFSKAYTKVEDENGIVKALIAPSSVYGDLDLLTDENNQPLNPPASWGKYRQLASNQISGKAVLGDFNTVVIGMRSQLNIKASGEAGTAFERLEIWIRGYIRCDIGIMIPEHLCKISNIGAASS